MPIISNSLRFVGRLGVRAAFVTGRAASQLAVSGGKLGARAAAASPHAVVTGFHAAIEHPKTVLAGAAIAGFATSHPLHHANEMGQSVSEGLYQNPYSLDAMARMAAIGTVAGSSAIGGEPGFGAIYDSAGMIGPGIATKYPQNSINPDPNIMLRQAEGRGMNPDGSIIFNLHQRRR